MNIPDRTGQVWEHHNRIYLVIGPARSTKWDPDAGLHDLLRLDDGRSWAFVEFDGRPLELDEKLKRIA